jgi:hypothetical protein
VDAKLQVAHEPPGSRVAICRKTFNIDPFAINSPNGVS